MSRADASMPFTAVANVLNMANLGGLLESSGDSNGMGTANRESHLLRMLEQLRKRLEVTKAENEQLEELLRAAETRAAAEGATAAKLLEQLTAVQGLAASTESSAAAKLAAAAFAQQEIAAKYDSAQKQVLVLEAEIAALREGQRRAAAAAETAEGSISAALTQQLREAEAKREAELRAHQATRNAAALRQAELEEALASSSAELASVTRRLEESAGRCRDLEDEIAVISAAHSELLQQQQHQQIGTASHASESSAELETLRQQLLALQQALSSSDSARHAAEASLAALKRDEEALKHEARSSHNEKDVHQLEAKIREMADMLYLKQTQLEKLSAEKAAVIMRQETDLAALRNERMRLMAQLARYEEAAQLSGSSAPLGHDVIPMDALGESYQRLTRNNRVGKAVKAAANFLDVTASTTSFVLRQYPLARVVVFVYIMLVHLYIYYLTARIQRQVLHMEQSLPDVQLH